MGKFFSFVHMGKSYISKVPIGPEVSKTNLGTGPGPCKKCGLGPGPGGPLIAAGHRWRWSSCDSFQIQSSIQDGPKDSHELNSEIK